MPENKPILALAEEKGILGLMSSPAEEEPYITSTKNPLAALGELTDAEAATEATGSLDQMSEWPEGGIASAGNIVDKMSGCAWRRSVYTTIATCRAHPAARRHCERLALFGNHANAETAFSALGETCLIWQPCEC